MKRHVRLYYEIHIDMPLYPGTMQVIVESIKSIARGDSCNTFNITFTNHSGTHIDAPNHFWKSGRSINEYTIDELVFRNSFLLDCPKGINEYIGVNDISELLLDKTPDLILIRTGFSKNRSTHEEYCYQNPYILPETAEWIRVNCPTVRALGIDCISVASYSYREIGRETHRILLKEDGFSGPAILIIEDMWLPTNTNYDEIIVSPLFIKGVDSAPCTVVGIVYD
ncbi:cyclase family protein [Candidatus Magnetobacterium bavaricum]|uniref:Cyclase family protein n=1 Tax=Candidatus Magnetobacterium bavaricum TaxID=29290 RepID=A0A0F3GHA5_9BACT|nr:cyclase family protein [Candidatus Magnetobacterium bavaricum]